MLCNIYKYTCNLNCIISHSEKMLNIMLISHNNYPVNKKPAAHAEVYSNFKFTKNYTFLRETVYRGETPQLRYC